MSALALRWRRTSRVLQVPAADAQRRWPRRDAVILTLEDGQGHVGEGEAAPLPGVSREDLAQVEAALASVALQAPSDVGVRELWAQVPAALPPSARFGLETALLALWAQRRGLDWVAALGGDPSRPLHSVALISSLSSDALALPAGCSGAKVKVGRPDQHQAELRFVAELRRRLGPDPTIRIDANRNFPSSTVRAQLEDYAALGVELAEEPCADSAALALEGGALPIGLDESLAEPGDRPQLERALDAGVIAALVLKPSLLGLAGSLAWARRGPPVIVSHLHEGAIARRALWALAATVPASRFAHGLGPRAEAP